MVEGRKEAMKHQQFPRSWIKRLFQARVREAKQSHKLSESDNVEFAFCKYQDICSSGAKLIQRSKANPGLYYILCLSPDGCNQKTIEPQEVKLKK
jgi:hypothetical protein